MCCGYAREGLCNCAFTTVRAHAGAGERECFPLSVCVLSDARAVGAGLWSKHGVELHACGREAAVNTGCGNHAAHLCTSMRTTLNSHRRLTVCVRVLIDRARSWMLTQYFMHRIPNVFICKLHVNNFRVHSFKQ